eukprot:8433914-Alexandrium_andersonii.AAC.1
MCIRDRGKKTWSGSENQQLLPRASTTKRWAPLFSGAAKRPTVSQTSAGESRKSSNPAARVRRSRRA